MDESIIKVSHESISWALALHGMEGSTLYEVPESACKQMADLSDVERNEFDWTSVWAAVELPNRLVNRFWDVIGQEARMADRFPDFIRAVRYAVVNETEPGMTAIAFRGFQWDYTPLNDAAETEEA